MLGKMLIHGLVAAAVIGSAAAVFAQAKDNGYLKPDAVLAQPAQAAVAPAKTGAQRADNGYLVAGRDASEQALRDHHHKKSEHRGEGRRHDDDDDD
jgi:hypothetical protein